jgi:hypothetical protein
LFVRVFTFSSGPDACAMDVGLTIDQAHTQTLSL